MFNLLRKVGRLPLVLTVIAMAMLIGGVVHAQGGGATIATFPHHFIPSEPGAGVDIDCGGIYPGLRGTYLCEITQTGNTITVTRQVPDPSTNHGVATEEFTFSLAGGQADGVVTAGAFSADNTELTLTITAGGTDSTVTITVPDALRTGGGGSATFAGLTDTPSDITAREFVRGNAAADALEFVPEPANDNTIPHVGRLPEVADDSPVLVFLSHDEIDGDREDATLTVGEALGRYCGYSNGDIFQAFGSINKASPIAMIFGVWDGTDCTIQTVHSANEGFIADIESVIFTVGSGTETTCNLGSEFQEYGYSTKRILSCPGLEDIATGDVTINFFYADGTSAYWNDGSAVHRAGLYEKVGTPASYHDLAPPEDAHKTGTGSAACGDSEPPDAAGQICVTSDGRGYFAMPRTTLETTPPTITVAAAGSDLFIPDLYQPTDLQTRTGLTDGQFIYVKTSQEFYQYQDPDFVVVSWTEAWQYIIDNVGDTATRQTFLASVFLGEFASEAEVARDRDGFSDDSVEYYFLYSDFGTLIHITAFTNSVTTAVDAGFAWRGPVIIPEEVLDVVAANDGEEIDEVLDSIQIGSQRYSVIVRPGENGQLRDPIAADYDTTNARSKVVAVVDGKPYKVRRTLVSGHSATGTFTEVAVGTELSAGGSGQFRWRGVYTADQDVSSPRENDIYYNIQYHHWRLRDDDDVYGDYWYTLPNGGEILTRLRFVDYFTSEEDALGHATAMGQRFVLPDGSDWALYTLSAFTAAEADHYEYSWTEAVPVPVLPANETLVDDLEVTFNAANRPSIEVKFSRALTAADDGRPVIIDYRPNAAGHNNRAVGGEILAEHVRHLTTLRPVALQKDPPGGRNPIDHTEDLPTGAGRISPGHIEFPFPLSSGDNDLHWMRLLYIGDHIDDMDGSFGSSATTITVNNPDDIVAGRNYWIVGPVSGGGCTESYHSERVTVTAIGDPNNDDLTVVRGLDSTDLPNACTWVSGADIIEDDKRTFILAATNDDQDSGNFTFTLLSRGSGSAGGSGDDSGGSGDITAITTPTGSGIGLTGCNEGDCSISLDIPGMTSVGLNLLTEGDEIILREGNMDRRTTLGNVSAYTFGRIVDQTDLTALADADSFVVNDASEGADDPREVTAARVSNYIGARLAGDGLTYNTTTNQLDGGGAPQIELIDSLNDVAYTQADTADLSSRFGGGATVYTADIDAEGTTDAEINDLIVFQWRDNPAAVPSDRALGIRINDSGLTLPIRIIDPLTNSLTNKTRADLTRYEFLFLSRQDGVFIQMSSLALADVMGRLLPDGGTAGQVLTKDTATDFDASWTTPASGGSGLLLQKHVVSSSTEVSRSNDTWTDLMTQSLTIAGATDRVFIDAAIFIEFIGGSGNEECDVRVTRDDTLVGAISGGRSYVQGEMHYVDLVVIDDSPGAGTYTYAVEGRRTATDVTTCNFQPDGTSSYATFEVLSANP